MKHSPATLLTPCTLLDKTMSWEFAILPALTVAVAQVAGLLGTTLHTFLHSTQYDKLFELDKIATCKLQVEPGAISGRMAVQHSTPGALHRHTSKGIIAAAVLICLDLID